MNFKTVFLLVVVGLLTITSCTPVSEGSESSGTSVQSENFKVQITDTPLTFCNPLNISVDTERTRRAGEPVVVLHQDDYFLFITGGRGYWYSDNMKDWTYVEVPEFPGGCPSVVSDGEKLIASGDKTSDTILPRLIFLNSTTG